MEKGVSSGLYNVGTGEDVTIAQLAELVMEVVGFPGRVVYDSSKPDGTPRKLLDVGRMAALGWRAKTGLKEGITRAYGDFLRRTRSPEATA